MMSTNPGSLADIRDALSGIDGIQTAFDVDLSEISRWKIGGSVDCIVAPATAQALSRVMQLCKTHNVPTFVLGDGSNMLFDSRGYRGVMIKLGPEMSRIDVTGTTVTCGAGIWVPYMAMRVARHGLTGIEHVVGIPGTLGGLVLMNGGSQRKGIGTHVSSVTGVDTHGNVVRLTQDDLQFSYRKSALQGAGFTITDVTLELAQGDVSSVRQEMISIMASRRKKFPKNLPNCGSTFLSNPAMYETVGPPGKAIEEVGLKGLTIGGAQISPLHANFLVNRGNATSQDVLALIAHIRQTVFEHTGYKMDCEARFLTAEGEELPAHEFTDAGRFDQSLIQTAHFAD